MTAPGDGFLDLEGVSLDDANVAVLSFPFEGTVTYGSGTSRGPSAILTASRELETFDEELAVDTADFLKVATLPPLARRSEERVEPYLGRVTSSCRGMGLAPPFPLGLGGEHSITPALLSGLRDDASEVTVVQIDAHADLRDEYLGSAHSHACAMRRVLDLGIAQLLAIGIRSASAEEHALAASRDDVHTWYGHELRKADRWQELLDRLRTLSGPVYLTVDVDGLDPSLAPGTGTPQPGGLSWYQVTDVLRALILEGSGQLFAADIMETAPQPGTKVNELAAAKLGLKILGYHFGGERPKRKRPES